VAVDGAIVERSNLKKALARVKANKGAVGIDGMTFEDLAPYLKEHWLAIRAQLLEGTYGPVRTVVWEGRSRETPPYPDCRPPSRKREARR
jgi:hypothetical protein